jgi:hypothetical protein
MGRYVYIFLVILCSFVLTNISFAQEPDTTETAPPPPSTSGAGSDFVDLTQEAVIIKIEPERPRVNIIADRLKPEFDDINLDKSFSNELTGKGEKVIIMDQKDQHKFKTIEVSKILNRTR